MLNSYIYCLTEEKAMSEKMALRLTEVPRVTSEETTGDKITSDDINLFSGYIFTVHKVQNSAHIVLRQA